MSSLYDLCHTELFKETLYLTIALKNKWLLVTMVDVYERSIIIEQEIA